MTIRSAETTQSIFLKIARDKGLLTEAQVTKVLRMQDVERARGGAARSIDEISLEAGLLTIEQVKGLERGVRYYVVRKADKRYATEAESRGIVDHDTVVNCLNKQKLDFTQRNRLARLSKLLLEIEAITLEQDAVLRDAVIERVKRKQEQIASAQRERVTVERVTRAMARGTVV